MAHRQQMQLSEVPASEPCMALNAVCPYYTMFPLEFPLSVLQRFKGTQLRVLDPFCGRGTTMFAARLKGHVAYGIDSSPIATAIARAKIAETTEADVVALAEELLETGKRCPVPKGDFWEWAFSPLTLHEICILREGLRSRRSSAATVLRAVCLGALHGPLTKCIDKRSYFSNQMPRTFASKPDYSVKYWRAHRLNPMPVDVLQIIKRRVARLELDTLPHCIDTSAITTADARLKHGFGSIKSKIDVVITSPPYYGMRTYVADQWLRNWFLGGSAEVPYGEKGSLSHHGHEAFSESLSRVWDRVGERFSKKGKMFVRFGAIPSRKQDSRQIILNSLEQSEFRWKVFRIREADSASFGRRQAHQMGTRIKSTAIEEHDYEIGLS